MNGSSASGRVVAVVVTFNRKRELVQCLGGIIGQSSPPSRIIVIDNASTDGSPEFAIESGLLGRFPIDYHRLDSNSGGAGGFHCGVALALNTGCEWLWLMDDDGLPDVEALRVTLAAAAQSGLKWLNSLVVDKDNSRCLSFRLGRNKDRAAAEARSDDNGLIIGEVNPFNGTLIHRSVFEAIGNIKREMFIWGDEKEFVSRARAAGFEVATVINAIQRHPQRVQRFRHHYFGLFKVPDTDLLKLYCGSRNQFYIHKRYSGFLSAGAWAAGQFAKYAAIADMRSLRVLLQAVADGQREIWGREMHYISPATPLRAEAPAKVA